MMRRPPGEAAATSVSLRPEAPTPASLVLWLSCKIMVDKITTMPRANVGDRVGRLQDSDLVRLDRALLVFLGLAG